MKRGLFAVLTCLAACATLASSARADEIHLKDGSVISGTIVGFDGGAFKVETEYGFAMVRKDSIAEIVPGDAKKAAASKTTPGKAPEAPAAQPAASVLAAPQPAGRAEPQPASYVAPIPEPVTPRAAPAPAPSKPLPPPAVKSSAPPAVAEAIAPPSPAPGPPVVQEFVRGNLYINQTYGFEMYRPPGWDVVKDAAQALPNAVAALGTDDETTLLIVSREVGQDVSRDIGRPPGSKATPQDPLDAHAAATDLALRAIYQDYKVLSSSRTVVGGLPAVQQNSHGIADGHAWSVSVLTFARENEVFTILGMTYADSDLIQIRENVIARMVSSLQFIPPLAR